MAANNFTTIIQPLLALGIQALRAKSVLPRLVNKAWGGPGSKFSTIDILIPSDIVATDVVPAHLAPDTQALAPTKISMQVDQWKEAAFTMTDKDRMQVSDGILPMGAQSAINALSVAVETHIWSKLITVPYVNGTSGTTPFATDLTAYTNARKALNKRNVPKEARIAIIDADAEANAINLRAFQDSSWRGDTGGIIDGEIGFKLGALWVSSNYVPTRPATALTAGALTVNGVNAAGATTVSLAKATNAAPLVIGNIITINGFDYDVTANTTLIVGNTAVPIYPALQATTAGGEAVTLRPAFVSNVLMHRDALAFVTRPLEESTPQMGQNLAAFDTIIDPESGLTLRLEVTREFKQWRWSYDILWGAGLIRPDFVQIMAG